MATDRPRFRSASERVDEYHARREAEVYWSAEQVAIRREAYAEQMAGIVRNTPCGDCGAATGTPCVGLTDAVHYGRQMRYAKTGWPIPC